MKPKISVLCKCSEKPEKLFYYSGPGSVGSDYPGGCLLPSIYESSSTILIEEQQIPEEFVRSTVTGFADQRIQSLTQQILSTSGARFK